MGMRWTFALCLLAPYLITLTTAIETTSAAEAGQAATCASGVGGAAVAGGGLAGVVALLLGTPLVSTAAGGLLVGSMAGGLLLDGCRQEKAARSPPARGPVQSAAHQVQLVQRKPAPMKEKAAVQEKALDLFLQRLMPHSTLENTAGQDQHCDSKGMCMVRKYRKKWPNCSNLRCFSDLTLEDAFHVCLSYSKCDGLSMSSSATDKERGSGCYKMACKDDGSSGYETGRDDYWVKTPLKPGKVTQLHQVKARHVGDQNHAGNCDGQGVCIAKKYQKKWPNCENLNSFSNVRLKDAKLSCLAHPACHGFSMSAGVADDGLGNGYYKTSCADDSWNGYSKGQDDYWAKDIVESSGNKRELASQKNAVARRCNGHGACIEERYKRKWPNCENLRCFNDMFMAEATKACLSNPLCDGLSIAESAILGERGMGCYKTKCKNDSWNGYEYGADGYWAKVGPDASKIPALAVPALSTVHAGLICKSHGSCIAKRYTGKWPNCKNIGCFSGLSLEAATKQCLSDPACNGFSISAGIGAGAGNGCYKTTCDHDSWNGYETGQDDYWAKVPTQAERKQQNSLRQLALPSAHSCDEHGTCIEKKYAKKWPNCKNLYCFTNLDLQSAKSTCLSHGACSGFSMSVKAMDGGRGNGCYKSDCENDSWNGYDVGADGYWAKVYSQPARALRQAQSVPRCNHKGSCIVKKFERKWPDCENLRCFSTTDLEDVKAACLTEAACDGFSISAMAMDGGMGDGCYKTKCKAEGMSSYRFEFGQDGYWGKVPAAQVAKVGEARKKESVLDALIRKRIGAGKVSATHAKL